MNEVPATRWATGSGEDIAYQVAGDGPVDVVYVPTGQTPIDLLWEQPRVARNLRRLQSFSRLVCMDVRGVGSSARVQMGDFPAIQTWGDDVLTVMDAAGCERAAVLAASESGLPAILVAATHPERISALVLVNCYARFTRDAQHPWAMPPAAFERYLAVIDDSVGTGAELVGLAPSVAADPRMRDWFGRCERLSYSRREGRALFSTWAATDVSDILETVRVPTLVIQRREAVHVRAGHGRFLAERIPGARYIELAGTDTLPFLGEADDLLDEVEEFLTGVRHGTEVDRVLATVLLSDIVGSTERAAQMGDRRWREALDVHDLLVRRQLERFRGQAVKATGDGMLATFDGPARAIRCACAIRDSVRSLGLEARVGLHTGEIERRDDDVGGIAVHIAARVNALAGEGEVLVSRTVRDLVAGSGIGFADRGLHALRGLPDEWQLFAVVDGRGERGAGVGA